MRNPFAIKRKSKNSSLLQKRNPLFKKKRNPFSWIQNYGKEIPFLGSRIMEKKSLFLDPELWVLLHEKEAPARAFLK